MEQQRYVVWLEALRMSDVAKVGGKNASLGEMISQLAHLGHIAHTQCLKPHDIPLLFHFFLLSQTGYMIVETEVELSLRE